MPCGSYLVTVHTENTVVMSCSVFKRLFHLIRKRITVSLACLAGHFYPTEWVYGAAERGVSLQTDYYLVILIDISGSMAGQSGYGFRIHIVNAASSLLLR